MAKDECPLSGDRLLLGPDIGDGSRPCVRHLPDHQIQTGIAQPLKDGKPINGAHEILAIKYDPRMGDFEVRSVYNPRKQAEAPQATPSKGPPKVTSDAYRAGYDRIFGHQTVGSA